MSFPSVSVIIPVKNEALKIKACIDGILQQSVPVHEIIVIDSGSTDDTVAILKTYQKVTLMEISSTEFNHGETRNLGVQKASGDFVLLTVGDARPYNKSWIEEMLKGFTDEEVAAVCGQQVVPHEMDKNPIEWFRPISEPELTRYQYKIAGSFESLSPIDKKKVCGWDDVTAMYRRDVLISLPYRKTSYAEDLLWCRDALIKGHAVVYNYAARVYHYHSESPEFMYKRTFTVLFYQYIAFQYIPSRFVLSVRRRISIVKHLLLNGEINLKGKIYWMRYNFNNQKSLKKAVKDFIYWQTLGDLELEEKHRELCGQAPIPLK